MLHLVAPASTPSWPDLIRPSNTEAHRLDTRVKPAYDAHWKADGLASESITIGILAFGFHHQITSMRAATPAQDTNDICPFSKPIVY